MSKKDSTKLKRFEVLNFQNVDWGGGGPVYFEKERDFDPHQPTKEDLLEAKKARANNSFFKKIQDKLFHNNATTQQSSSSLSLNEKKELEIESISCHICGNICKEKDYFCAECGAKLKTGHYND